MRAGLKQLEDIFIQKSEDGFDTKSSLKWSFYFVDEKKEQLEKLYQEMEQHDYTVETFEKDDENAWVLKVSKIDILNPEKLHRRNIAFNELANYCDVKVYDGWDVEKL